MTVGGPFISKSRGAILPIAPVSRTKDDIVFRDRRGELAPSDDVPVVPTVGIVVPCFNEEEVLPETAHRLSLLLQGMMAGGKVAEDSQVVFIDDGSRDGTWDLIETL